MKKTPCLSALLAALALSACHNGAVDYPKLLPTQQILAEPTLPEHSGEAAQDPDSTQAETVARAEALRRKAEAMNAPVIEPATKARMTEVSAQ